MYAISWRRKPTARASSALPPTSIRLLNADYIYAYIYIRTSISLSLSLSLYIYMNIYVSQHLSPPQGLPQDTLRPMGIGWFDNS